MSLFQTMATDGGDGVGKEKSIEQKLVRATKGRGGICPKLVSPGFDGMPDRLVLLPHGKIGFVEVKARVKSRAPYRHRGTGSSGGLALRYTYWMTRKTSHASLTR